MLTSVESPSVGQLLLLAGDRTDTCSAQLHRHLKHDTARTEPNTFISQICSFNHLTNKLEIYRVPGTKLGSSGYRLDETDKVPANMGLTVQDGQDRQ